MTLVEQDLQQLRAMEERLALFRRGGLPLHALVADLEILLTSLDQVPATWRGRFLDHWATLEEVNAVALDEGRPPAEIDGGLVESSVAGLEELVREARGG